jgi:hypothetical protein
MALTEEQRQSIREEEFFRHEVRSELSTGRPPPHFLANVANFFETKAGFWILTTVLAGTAVTGFNAIDKVIHRAEIADNVAAEKSRRDTDTLIKLGPMLTSDNAPQRDVAIVLLNGLALSNAIDGPIAGQVKALFENTTALGTKDGATAEEKAQASSIVAFADRARVASIQAADANSSTSALPISPALDNASLPVRIYLQIARDQDRAQAEVAAKALRSAGLLVPGIELVAPNRVPTKNDLRYCADKTDEATLTRIKAAVALAVSPQPVTIPLNPKACTKVRTNHFEIWYARQS